MEYALKTLNGAFDYFARVLERNSGYDENGIRLVHLFGDRYMATVSIAHTEMVGRVNTDAREEEAA